MIGTKLANRYELLSELGAGGMGVVYRARDPWLEREVAVKMVPPFMLDAASEERFCREARIVAQLDHPGIVPIHDFGRHEGSLFFVMPVVDGVMLTELIEDRALVSQEAALIAAETAEALAHAHERGVVHRDVKPSNVMVGRENGEPRVRVMDFGLARDDADPRKPQTVGIAGTPAYLSPEQVRGERLDARSDIYSLGAVLYECLAGEVPFDGPLPSVIYRIGHEMPARFSQRGAEVDEALEHIVFRCLAKDPADRPRDARQLAAALRAYLRPHRRPVEVPDLPDEPRAGTPPPLAGSMLPLVGRHREWSRIRERFDDALAGECQLVLLGGEAGVGKSRLLQELESLAAERRVRVLRGRYSDFEEGFQYEGLCDLVQDYYRNLDPRRSSASAAEAAEAERPDAAEPPEPAAGTSAPDVSDLAPELLSLFPVLSEIPELRRAEAAAETLPRAREAPASPTYVFEVLARTLLRLADGEPLVLLLENLHEADASVEALKYLVHRLAPAPFLIAGSYRPAQLSRGHSLLRWIRSFRDQPRALALGLEPLSSAELRQLTENMVGCSRLRDDMVERLYEATEGNPLFARELVRSLLEAGSLVRDTSGFWTWTGEAALTTRGAIPSTLQQAVERRLERLPEAQRTVLAVAAVLGKSFDGEDLTALLEGTAALSSDEVDEAVDQLTEQGVLREDRKARGDRLVFVSGLVRTVLYRDLSRRRRRSLHRRAARYLERRAAGHPERSYPMLVHHFSAGDVPEKTVEYALAQARWSLAAWNPEDAVRAARIGLEFVEEDEVEDSVRISAELLEILARAHRALGQNGQAFEEAEKAVAAFRQSGENARAASASWLASQAAWQARRIEETRRTIDETAELARVSGELEVLRRALLLGSTVANLRGESDLARRYREDARRAVPPEDAVSEPPPVSQGGTLHVALPLRIGRIDPAEIDSDEHCEVVTTVFETLLRLDGEGNLLPALCADWTTSADGFRFELTLRPGVRFSDGHPVEARDVKASFERLARRRTDSPPMSLAAVAGREAWLRGESGSIAGIEVPRGETLRVVFHLEEPLPIFPVLLTDPYTAVVRRGPSGELLGTGPFRLAALVEDRILLEKNPLYRGEPASLDQLDFHTSLGAGGIAEGLRSGALDVGRDFLLQDLEDLLRDPRFRSGLVEATRQNVHFVLWNRDGPLSRHRRVRRALTGVIRPTDLVWRTLGRFAEPAVCLMPPGIPGHDPGRRQRSLTLDEARELLHRVRLPRPLRLRAAAHPSLLDRGRHLLEALFKEWAALGVEVELEERSLADYLATYQHHQDVDLLLGRWVSDYNDPDTFTYGLFHSRHGLLRRYFSSPEADELLERARLVTDMTVRQALYQRFESLLDREAVFLPLFHDIAYRLAGPRVQALRLDNVPPYVSYETVGKEEDTAGGARWPLEKGELHVPIIAPLESLDPVGDKFAEHLEVVSTLFEGLTRLDENAAVVPWLAESLEASPDGRTYKVRLRGGVRFHDGRRLTARDVRYSFERAVRETTPGRHFMLLPVRGARALRDGEAETLEGLQILSTDELLFELDDPVPYFPALLAHPSAGIVAEGAGSLSGSWREGCVGTGPFRVVRFEAGGNVELERHPQYWRPGFPRSERLTFHCGLDPRQVAAGFREGRYSLASDLRPADVEALRRDPELVRGCLEAPRLSSLVLAFNSARGPLADAGLRRALARALDVDSLFRDAAGPQARRASGLIPPGLLGHEDPRKSSAPSYDASGLRGVRVKVAVISGYTGQYTAIWERLRSELRHLGMEVDVAFMPVSDVVRVGAAGECDAFFLRWLADYPDPDTFVSGLLHSRDGVLSGMCRDSEIDRLCERGRREMDASLRHAIYRELEERLARKAYLVPLLHEQSYRFCHPSVEGVRVYFALPEMRYEEICVRR